MNSKKIIIYQYDAMFNILNEISERFNFELTRADEENFDEIIGNLKGDFLLITKKPLDNFKNFFIIDEKPIRIKKLIEQINLSFLKNKFSAQSGVVVGAYKLDLNSREIRKKDIKIPLTEREVNLILFLKNSKKPVKIEELQKKVWEYGSELETHTVETHIYRLRKKIKEKFHDESFILSIKEGYIIK
ncbi:MAG: winged helix-turn-helix domain-containing protein [Candidatus Pelagibacter sp.]